MIQETSAANPLARDTAPSTERLQQVAVGVRALLLSDHVLTQAIEALEPVDGFSRATAVRQLRESLSLELVGTDFLEFKLSGSKAAGLGKRLEIVLSRLAEALISQSGANFSDFLLSSWKTELVSAEALRSEFLAQLAGVLPPGVADLDQLAEQLSALNGGLEDSHQKLRRVVEELKQIQITSGDQVDGQADRTSSLEALKSQLTVDIAKADREIGALRSAERLTRPLHERVSGLTKRVSRLKKSFAALEPYSSQNHASRASMMSAPERMVVVDPPVDPSFRTKSRIVFVASGILAGVLLGLALVVVAEFLDGTLRDLDEIGSVAQAPIVARIRIGPADLDPTNVIRVHPTMKNFSEPSWAERSVQRRAPYVREASR